MSAVIGDEWQRGREGGSDAGQTYKLKLHIKQTKIVLSLTQSKLSTTYCENFIIKHSFEMHFYLRTF